jgi:hypothetical protein
VWWYTSIISALRRPGQEDHKFMVNLGYIMSSRPAWARERPCLKEKNKTIGGWLWLTPIILATRKAEIGRIEV